jgi:FAD/FMN-containing dehydrogenase
VIDMVNMQKFAMDSKTWQATIGAGTRLGEVTKRMHDNGKRAMAHGTCPGVGIGGHATIVSLTYHPTGS